MFAPLALHDALAVDLTRLRLVEWLALAYYGVVVTVVALVLWARGVREVEATTAAVFTGVLPVSAVTLSYIVLGEPFQRAHVIGGVCVLAAAFPAARADSVAPRLLHVGVSGDDEKREDGHARS